MDTIDLHDNSLSTLRRMMFDQLVSLRNGDSTYQECQAVAQLGGKVIDTYRVEIEAVRAANDLKDKNNKYAPALKAIKNDLPDLQS